MVQGASAIPSKTGKYNTANDVNPGSSVDWSAQGIPSSLLGYQGLLGRLVRLRKDKIAQRWDAGTTGGSFAAPAYSDIALRYVKMASDSPVNPTRGVLCFWKDKDAYEVTTDDTGDFELAGVLLGILPEDGKHGWIGVGGTLPVKFKSSTTKATPAVGDVVTTTSGDSGLADVKADATAQTYGTSNANEVVGRLFAAVSSQIGAVTLRAGLDWEG